MLRTIFLSVSILCTSALAFGADEPQRDFVFQDVERVVAIGDVHGAFEALHTLLAGIGIIDAQGNWTAGETHLVSVGDLVDRGPRSKDAIDLLRRLAPQAEQAGGRVHVLLGNHEVMNLTYDYADLSMAEIDSYGGQEAFVQAFSVQGEYGSWLLSLPVVIQINQTLFLHGGLSSDLQDIASTNESIAQQLRVLKSWGDPLALAGEPMQPLFEVEREDLPPAVRAAQDDPLLGPDGPLWYRGSARCHPFIEDSALKKTLQHLGAERVVVGHTPTPSREITQRLGGQAILIDTGMLSSVYRGEPRALEITNGQIRALGPAGPSELVQDSALNARRVEVLRRGLLVEDEEGFWLQRNKRRLAVEFTRARSNERRRTLAAFELDRLLGLDLVPAVSERTVDGRTGLVTFRRSYVAEAERTFAPANECEQGSAFDLVPLFDGLIGKRDRDAKNIVYEANARRLRLIDHGKAFGRSAELPRYAALPKLPQGALERLEALDRGTLEGALGGLLKPAEIEGILKRRDAMRSAWLANE